MDMIDDMDIYTVGGIPRQICGNCLHWTGRNISVEALYYNMARCEHPDRVHIEEIDGEMRTIPEVKQYYAACDLWQFCLAKKPLTAPR